jgi:DNA-binding CsgD family transcriptional regulator
MRPPLSLQEWKIAGLIHEGRASKNIAPLLGITEGTVKQYRTALYAKLKLTHADNPSVLIALMMERDELHLAPIALCLLMMLWGLPPLLEPAPEPEPSAEAQLALPETAAAARAANGDRRRQSPAAVRFLRKLKRGTERQVAEAKRWEKIFQEKFADPDYYGRIEVHQGSSLARF